MRVFNLLNLKTELDHLKTPAGWWGQRSPLILKRGKVRSISGVDKIEAAIRSSWMFLELGQWGLKGSRAQRDGDFT